MRAPKATTRFRVSSAVPSRISTVTGGWMLAASRKSFTFLFCLPQETSDTPSTSSAAQRAILPMTSVEICRVPPFRSIFCKSILGPPSKISVGSFILFPSLQGDLPAVQCLCLLYHFFLRFTTVSFGSGVGFCKRRLSSHTHRQQTKNTSSRQSGGRRRIGTTCGGRVLNTLCSPPGSSR